MAISALGLRKFFGKAAGDAAGFAFGQAASPALTPPIQEIINQAWRADPARPVDVALLAEGVSTRQIDHDWAKAEAQLSGFDGDRFDKMVAAFDTGPGVATAFALWRRGIIDVDGFRKAAGREGLEAEWIADLEDLHDVLLSQPCGSVALSTAPDRSANPPNRA